MYSAIAIGTQHANAGVIQPLEQFLVRMTVGVTFSRGDDRHLGPHGCQKVLGRRILAAVVADFQDVGAQLSSTVFRQHLVLGFLLRVPGQEHCSVSVAQAKNKRVVVFCGWCSLC